LLLQCQGLSVKNGGSGNFGKILDPVLFREEKNFNVGSDKRGVEWWLFRQVDAQWWMVGGASQSLVLYFSAQYRDVLFDET
jgi:hypothetical protein